MSKPYSHSRWWDNPKMIPSQCNDCKYFYGFGKCQAFPDGIPIAIMDNDVLHDHPIEGDQGLQRTLKDSE